MMHRLIVLLFLLGGTAWGQLGAVQELALARQAFQQRDYPRVLALLHRIDSLQPNQPEVYLLQAQAHLKLSRKDLALQSANRAIQLDNKNAEALLLRGKVLKSMGQYIAALSDFNQAVVVKPGHAEIWYYRGLTRIELNERHAGCEDLGKAAELGNEMAIDSKDVYCK
ncbi:MAG: tetratricopeptide repeat protein [Bacteroidetes bacterium]|nr:tetratricopeptide repeat protein [Bacteroidota bacterium]